MAVRLPTWHPPPEEKGARLAPRGGFLSPMPPLGPAATLPAMMMTDTSLSVSSSANNPAALLLASSFGDSPPTVPPTPAAMAPHFGASLTSTPSKCTATTRASPVMISNSLLLKLPAEILALTASFLPQASLLALSESSKTVYRAILAHDTLLWQPLLLTLWRNKMWFQQLVATAEENQSLTQQQPSCSRVGWLSAQTFLLSATSGVMTASKPSGQPVTVSPVVVPAQPAVLPVVGVTDQVELLGSVVQVSFRRLLIASYKLGKATGITGPELHALHWSIAYHNDAPVAGPAAGLPAAAVNGAAPRPVVFEPSSIPGSHRLRAEGWNEPLPCQLTQGGKALHVSVFPSLVVSRRASDWAWVIRNYFVRMESALVESELTLRLLRRYLLQAPQRPP